MSIRLEGLAKSFGGQPVVKPTSLEVRDGELFVLLGASGSGKSTVLRMVAGLTAPDAGGIWLRDRDVTRLPPQERGIGFVFQNYSIFRHMSVGENIEFPLKIRKMPAAERARKREELLDRVGLGGFGNRYAHQLSGGQQQRVALARALVHEPSVLLLDEPFGALDVKIRSQLRRNLREIQQQLGVTAILVTHDQEEAFELADRIGLMERAELPRVPAAGAGAAAGHARHPAGGSRGLRRGRPADRRRPPRRGGSGRAGGLGEPARLAHPGTAPTAAPGLRPAGRGEPGAVPA